jgi:multidrug transporter EmrE-like cation transporter
MDAYHLVTGASGRMAVDGRKTMITGPVIAMILISVGCSAVAQIALKHGMSISPVQAKLADGGMASVALAVAASPTVWLGLFLYGFSAAVWLFVLARLDVSVAYAFVALGFLLTTTLGCLLLNEPLTWRKLCGTVLVMLGIWLVAGER